MKKIFLVFGIVAFSSAAAQQNNVFNVESYLQKKTDNKNEKIEKNSYLSSEGCFGGPLVQKAIPNYLPGFLLPNGDRIKDMAPLLYNMPCVRPDMRQFRTMPNPGLGILPSYFSSGPLPGQIPNGAFPYKKYIVSK